MSQTVKSIHHILKWYSNGFDDTTVHSYDLLLLILINCIVRCCMRMMNEWMRSKINSKPVGWKMESHIQYSAMKLMVEAEWNPWELQYAWREFQMWSSMTKSIFELILEFWPTDERRYWRCLWKLSNSLKSLKMLMYYHFGFSIILWSLLPAIHVCQSNIKRQVNQTNQSHKHIRDFDFLDFLIGNHVFNNWKRKTIQGPK